MENHLIGIREINPDLNAVPAGWEDPLTSYEKAEAAIQAGTAGTSEKIAAVLALARGGATDLALTRFHELNLGALGEEGSQALFGRINKDRADLLTGSERERALKASATAYNNSWTQTCGTYSGINAATMYILAGQEQTGRHIAEEVLGASVRTSTKGSSEARYYRIATQAEALLLLGEQRRSRETLISALKADPKNYVAHATTLRQFERILKHRKLEFDWLDAHRPPRMIAFTGRMLGIPETGSETNKIAREIDTFLDANRIHSAFGALAAGGDILFAEAYLERGGSLNVVLPCRVDAFEDFSVKPYGAGWSKRFRKCLLKATSVFEATHDESLMGEEAITLAGQISMGQAIIKAKSLATRPMQVLVQPREHGVSQRFRERWKASERGFETDILADKSFEPSVVNEGVQPRRDCDRFLAAMLFADLTGFGRLCDASVMQIVDRVLRPVSQSVFRAGAALLHVDSWGDGIFAVFDHAASAAKTALDMQSVMRNLDIEDLNLPSAVALRVGLHYGPITRKTDPLTNRIGVFGSQVSYASRIEPVAVPGAVVASEVFAASLALEPDHHATSHYIGRHALKGISEPVRLYSIN